MFKNLKNEKMKTEPDFFIGNKTLIRESRALTLYTDWFHFDTFLTLKQEKDKKVSMCLSIYGHVKRYPPPC